jgi:hypothetical protein
MKKVLISFLILLFALQLVKGQNNDTSQSKSPQMLHDMYMQKRKANNTVGCVLLGSGAAMIVGSFVINLSGGVLGGGSISLNPRGNTTTSSNSNRNTSKGVWLGYVGGATTLASIPFFISARANKTKATLALKEEVITIGNRMVDKSNSSAIAFTIQL